MEKLFLITVPGLDVRSDWRVLHDRLLDEFPAVSDVLATTIGATILIVYAGRTDADAWLETIAETVLGLRQRARGSTAAPRVSRAVGGGVTRLLGRACGDGVNRRAVPRLTAPAPRGERRRRGARSRAPLPV